LRGSGQVSWASAKNKGLLPWGGRSVNTDFQVSHRAACCVFVLAFISLLSLTIIVIVSVIIAYDFYFVNTFLKKIFEKPNNFQNLPNTQKVLNFRQRECIIQL